MRATLAAYHGWARHGWPTDTAIRLATLSPYSHVELAEGEAHPGEVAVCWSSSPRDGGVRSKKILLGDKWRLIPVDVPGDAFARIAARSGRPYDLRGALLSPLRRDHDLGTPGAWFCSEVIADAMRLTAPWAWSPGRLVRWAARSA
ncbi:hypothetical protein [Tropicimonas sp. IMCC34011]|uniref:hypothetical protein n=1 Tax=Tropicimonas sp. IMCC34011 TaxID=2248759 RepID=UPI000E266898|nr:hypothetical protein [Tropicimonas sp. IMCC34011]